MLTIAEHQMASLRSALAEDFALRLERHLRDCGHTGPVRDAIACSRSLAADFGLQAERDVARLAELLLQYAAGVSGEVCLPPQALSILSRHGTDPGARLESLAHWIGEGRA